MGNGDLGLRPVGGCCTPPEVFGGFADWGSQRLWLALSDLRMSNAKLESIVSLWFGGLEGVLVRVRTRFNVCRAHRLAPALPVCGTELAAPCAVSSWVQCTSALSNRDESFLSRMEIKSSQYTAWC